jgi:hypothetical protein
LNLVRTLLHAVVPAAARGEHLDGDEQLARGHLGQQPTRLVHGHDEDIRLHERLRRQLDVERRRAGTAHGLPLQLIVERQQDESNRSLMQPAW